MTKLTGDKSKCCNADTFIGGMGDFKDKDKATTRYYVCTACNKPCDVAVLNSVKYTTLKDLEPVEEKKYEIKWIGTPEPDFDYKIRADTESAYVSKTTSDLVFYKNLTMAKNGEYCEFANGNWYKFEDGKKIGFANGKYYINDIETKLK